MRNLTMVILATALLLGVIAVRQSTSAVDGPQTEIRTGAMLGSGFDPRSFYVRQPGGTWRPTYAGQPIEGRLMNFRAANAIFDDEARTDDDPTANTNTFVNQFDAYRAHGILAMTVSLQGGNPGYTGAVVSAFNADGTLKPAWLQRTAQVIEAADDRGMIIILTYFYQHQDQVFTDAAAVRRAVINATDWLIAQNYRNVIIEIANEHRNAAFDHDLIRKNLVTGGIGELINLAKSRFAGRDWQLPVSATIERIPQFIGALATTADVALVHGGYLRDWEGTWDTYQEVKSLVDTHAIPVVMNEDNNSLDKANAISLDREIHALDDVLAAGGSWGLMWRPYNQLYPMQWTLGDPRQVTQQAGYFHAVLDAIQIRTGAPIESDETATPTFTATPLETPTSTEPAATPTFTPSPTATQGDVSHEVRLLYSLSANRSQPRPLEGATVSGTIYVFTSPDTGVEQVVFSLNDTTVRTEANAPFDFAGGTVTRANPWRTTDAANGTHTIHGSMTLGDGTTQTVTASFVVQN